MGGKRAPIVGTVSMDLTMIDVTDVPGAAVRDEVVDYLAFAPPIMVLADHRRRADKIDAAETARSSDQGIAHSPFCSALPHASIS